MSKQAPDVALVIQPFIKWDTLERQLDSLLRCELRENVTLILFSDNPSGASDEYVRKNEHVMARLEEFRNSRSREFKDVIVHRINERSGPYRTCELAIDFALTHADFAIFSEDDTVFARDAIVWFTKMHESGILDREDTWAIAGESIYFDAREKTPTAEHVERAKSLCLEQGYYSQYIPLDFIPSTSFATTRAKWKVFGAVRGQTVGDTALAELCRAQRKCCVFPIVARVKDIGMLHPDGHSVRVLGTAEVRTREPKNTYVMSEDLLDSQASPSHFREFTGDPGRLFQQSVLLEPFEMTERVPSKVLAAGADDLAALHARARTLIQANEREEARELLSRIVEECPDFPGAHDDLVSLLLPGPYYLDVLRAVHETLRPDTYLEIGVERGATLSLATTTSVAAGVDPAMHPLEHPLPTGARLFHDESDAFFARETRESVFGERTVDLGFVDGMHLFEFALRDFANTERWAAKDSTILLHDCLPPSRVSAERACRSTLWVGDVWKVVECLREYRPDLSIRIIPTAPSGLVVVRNLDPHSNVLSSSMPEISARYIDLEYSVEPEEWRDRYRFVENSVEGVRQALRSP